jgi:hypothetical protein
MPLENSVESRTYGLKIGSMIGQLVKELPRSTTLRS